MTVKTARRNKERIMAIHQIHTHPKKKNNRINNLIFLQEIKEVVTLMELNLKLKDQEQQALRALQHQSRKTGEIVMKMMKQRFLSYYEGRYNMFEVGLKGLNILTIL